VPPPAGKRAYSNALRRSQAPSHGDATSGQQPSMASGAVRTPSGEKSNSMQLSCLRFMLRCGPVSVCSLCGILSRAMSPHFPNPTRENPELDMQGLMLEIYWHYMSPTFYVPCSDHESRLQVLSPSFGCLRHLQLIHCRKREIIHSCPRNNYSCQPMVGLAVSLHEIGKIFWLRKAP